MRPLTRRAAVAGLLTITLAPLRSSGADADVAAAIIKEFGERIAQLGKVNVKLPGLAETGNLVPISVSVDSPMSASDRVARVCIFADRNPRPFIGEMAFGPSAGKAAFSTNMRLSGTQDVIVIAEMADKSLWKSETRVTVTVGACDALQSRY